MIWVCSHYKYFYSFSAGIDFRRQILTPKAGPRTERVNKCDHWGVGVGGGGAGYGRLSHKDNKFTKIILFFWDEGNKIDMYKILDNHV